MPKPIQIEQCYWGEIQDDGTVLLDQRGDCNNEALIGLTDLLEKVKQEHGRCLVLIDFKEGAEFSARRAVGSAKEVFADAMAFVGGGFGLRTAVTVAHRTLVLTRGAKWKMEFFKTREEAVAWLATFKKAA